MGVPACAAFIASNSALVGNRRGPFGFSASASRCALSASNSALVGNRRGPVPFLAGVFFAGVFFAGAFFAGFLLALFFATTVFFLLFLSARTTATNHPLFFLVLVHQEYCQLAV